MDFQSTVLGVDLVQKNILVIFLCKYVKITHPIARTI